MSKSSDNELYLREKDERIRDLLNEVKLLQKHNEELLELSVKFSKTEQENIDLKRKITEQMSDSQSLRSSLQEEKTNNSALQAANEQLLEKLHDHQKNIDLLTIQLMVNHFYNTIIIFFFTFCLNFKSY